MTKSEEKRIREAAQEGYSKLAAVAAELNLDCFADAEWSQEDPWNCNGEMVPVVGAWVDNQYYYTHGYTY